MEQFKIYTYKDTYTYSIHLMHTNFSSDINFVYLKVYVRVLACRLMISCVFSIHVFK